jgi:hypothetical protein
MQPGWAEGAGAWAAAELARLGRRVTGPIESVHARIWSTVLKIPTGTGDVFLKAAGPAGAHEPALLRLLSRSWPRCMPDVLGVDEERAWVLLADGGQRLRERLTRDPDIGHWRRLLPLYAQVQIDLVDRTGELLPLGVPDDRLATLPASFRSLVNDTEMLHLDAPDGLRSSDHERLRALTSRVADLCARLLACGVPETLHHGDLHDGNIFVHHDGAEPAYTFFDWGDSCLTHPFFTLRTTAASVGRTLGLTPNSGEWSDLRDAYLEPWTRFASRSAISDAADLAEKLAPIEGALRWHHVLRCVPADLREPWREPIPRLLEDVLAAVG